jgi:DNA-binding response OmpR family regulator
MKSDSTKRERPILIVEDDFVLRTSLAELLQQQGYEVECAADGLEAYHLLNAGTTKPAVIVLDLMMPRMDGLDFQVMAKALPSAAGVPIVIMTASQDYAEATAGMAERIFHKPVNTSRFLTTIRSLIH